MQLTTLTGAEILIVSGGDAAATRLPGQNSWGEGGGGATSGPDYWECFVDDFKGIFTGRWRPDCP